MFVQSLWHVGNGATVSIGINVHYKGTQTIWNGVNRQYSGSKEDTPDQSAPIQPPPILGRISQHKRLFHISVTSSQVWSRWARIEDDISAEKKGQRIVWRLHLSRHRRESWNHHKEGIDKNVTVNSSDNAENSEKNLSTVKPRRKTCNQRW